MSKGQMSVSKTKKIILSAFIAGLLSGPALAAAKAGPDNNPAINALKIIFFVLDTDI